MKYLKHIKTPRTLVVILTDGKKEKSFSFASTDTNYGRIAEALTRKKYKDIPALVDPNERVKDQLGESITVTPEGRLLFEGKELPRELEEEFRKGANAGTDHKVLIEFWKRLRTNPLTHSITQLFHFMKVNGIHILPDGRFVVYKGVNKRVDGAGYDPTMHGAQDGTRYRIGEYTTVDRSRCNSNPELACGFGLHTAPWQYVRQLYNSGILIALICDPADVVSVPNDHDSRKIRLCRVLTVSEVTQPFTESLITTKAATGVAGKYSNEIKKKIKKDGKQINVECKTDRVNLPSEFMALAGFQRDSNTTISILSGTKKHLYIHLVGHEWDERFKSKEVESKPIKMASSGAFRFTSSFLRKAGFPLGVTYTAKISGPGHIEFVL